ncbi:MAG: thioesterase family protein [Actinomycetota bacterium]
MIGGPTDRCPPFRFSAQARVDVSDTDLFRIVYYGRFLPYFDGALIAYRRHIGVDLIGPDGHRYVVRHVDVDYRQSARFDDLLEVFVRVAHVGRTSHTVAYRVERLADGGSVHVADGRAALVGLDADRRPTPVPDAVRDAIVAFEGDRVELG